MDIIFLNVHKYVLNILLLNQTIKDEKFFICFKIQNIRDFSQAFVLALIARDSFSDIK